MSFDDPLFSEYLHERMNAEDCRDLLTILKRAHSEDTKNLCFIIYLPVPCSGRSTILNMIDQVHPLTHLNLQERLLPRGVSLTNMWLVLDSLDQGECRDLYGLICGNTHGCRYKYSLDPPATSVRVVFVLNEYDTNMPVYGVSTIHQQGLSNVIRNRQLQHHDIALVARTIKTRPIEHVNPHKYGNIVLLNAELANRRNTWQLIYG
jgi:hypothetical protein